jgi:hypothetical protein
MPGLLSDVLPYVFSRGDALKRYMGGLLSDPMGSMSQTAGLLGDARQEDQRLNTLAFADPQQPFKVTDQNALSGLIDRTMAGPMGFAPAGMTAQAGMPYWHNPNKPPKLDQQGQVRDGSGAGSREWAGTDTPERKAESLARDMRQMLAEDWKGKDFDPSSVRQGLSMWADEQQLNKGLVFRSFLRELNATKDIPDSAKKRVIEAWSTAANQ